MSTRDERMTEWGWFVLLRIYTIRKQRTIRRSLDKREQFVFVVDIDRIVRTCLSMSEHVFYVSLTVFPHWLSLRLFQVVRAINNLHMLINDPPRTIYRKCYFLRIHLNEIPWSWINSKNMIETNENILENFKWMWLKVIHMKLSNQ